MKFDISQFDPKKIGNLKPNFVLRTNSYRKIESVFQDVLEYSLLVVLIGEPGYGKSCAFEHLVSIPNSYLFRVEKSSTGKIFYTDILKKLGIENTFSNSSLNSLIRSVSYNLNETPDKKIMIFDEAGKITAQKLLFLHEFRDATKNNVGIILSGPAYFKDAFTDWNVGGVEGIPELYSRVQSWHIISKPPMKDKRAFCEAHGVINRDLIEQLCRKNNNYRSLENDIIPFKIAYQRYLKKSKKIELEKI